eukprot:844443-Lingulodinium_polyedra.AAC.1
MDVPSESNRAGAAKTFVTGEEQLTGEPYAGGGAASDSSSYLEVPAGVGVPSNPEATELDSDDEAWILAEISKLD